MEQVDVLRTRKTETNPLIEARWWILHWGHRPWHAVQRIIRELGRPSVFFLFMEETLSRRCKVLKAKETREEEAEVATSTVVLNRPGNAGEGKGLTNRFPRR